MYFDDREPPHFQAVYVGTEAQVGIDPIGILEGGIPSRAASMVVERAALHQGAVMENWRRLRNDQSIEKIDPLI